MRSKQWEHDETVRDGDDAEWHHADEHERQRRAHVLLEVPVRLRTTAHSHPISLHFHPARPEHVEVLGDGDQYDDEADGERSSRGADDVLDKR